MAVQQDLDESRVLTVAEHCPAALMRPHWSVKQFNLQNLLYMGNNSRVLRAVDTHTGITVALKVYNKNKLSDMEKCASRYLYGLWCSCHCACTGRFYHTELWGGCASFCFSASACELVLNILVARTNHESSAIV